MSLHSESKLCDISCQVDFGCSLDHGLCSQLIKETLKHIIYQRQQIPRPYDELKPKHNVATTNQIMGHSLREPCAKFDSSYKLSIASRRQKQAIQGLEGLFQSIELLFGCGVAVPQVLVLLGASTLNPKEFYQIELPTLHATNENTLPLKTCTRKLFKSLITCHELYDLKAMPPTNIFIMVKAPRTTQCSDIGLLPKFGFKFPRRGSSISITFNTKHPEKYEKPCSPNSARHLVDKLTRDYDFLSTSSPIMQAMFATGQHTTDSAIQEVNRFSIHNDSSIDTLDSDELESRELTDSDSEHERTAAVVHNMPLLEYKGQELYSGASQLEWLSSCSSVQWDADSPIQERNRDTLDEGLTSGPLIRKITKGHPAKLGRPLPDVAQPVTGDMIWYQLPFTVKGYRSKEVDALITDDI